MSPTQVEGELAERPLVLAVDVGTSSVRAGVHDAAGRTVRGTLAQVAYPWDVGGNGSVRLDPAVLHDAVGTALDEAVGRAGPLAAELVAGGISCFLHSIVGLDDAGRPVTPVLSWADTTSALAATALRGRLDPAGTHARTGAPIHSTYWPARILHLRAEFPTAVRWVGYPELLAELLTGRRVVSRSMASGTGLVDRASGGWSAALLAELGVAEDQLASIADDGDVIGETNGKAAGRWPALAGVPWFGPWGDGPCSNVGLEASGPTQAALVIGTSGALRAVMSDPAPLVPPGLFAQRLGPGSVVGGQLSEGGGLLAWARSLLGASPDSLETRAGLLKPDSHGLTVLPYLAGERGLGYHDSARCSIVGLSAATDGVALYRALLESLALSVAAVDERLTATLGAPPRIIASGGALTASPLLAGMVADALGRPISIEPGVEASLRGAALLALRSAGHAHVPPGGSAHAVRVHEPDPERTSAYRSARLRRDQLYEVLLGAR